MFHVILFALYFAVLALTAESTKAVVELLQALSETLTFEEVGAKNESKEVLNELIDVMDILTDEDSQTIWVSLSARCQILHL